MIVIESELCSLFCDESMGTTTVTELIVDTSLSAKKLMKNYIKIKKDRLSH